MEFVLRIRRRIEINYDKAVLYKLWKKMQNQVVNHQFEVDVCRQLIFQDRPMDEQCIIQRTI